SACPSRPPARQRLQRLALAVVGGAPMPGPLSTNLHIVDVTAGLAGAYGARLLADLGARVTRLSDTRSLARRLDPSRQVADWAPGLHRVLNAGKDLLSLDPVDP